MSGPLTPLTISMAEEDAQQRLGFLVWIDGGFHVGSVAGPLCESAIGSMLAVAALATGSFAEQQCLAELAADGSCRAMVALPGGEEKLDWACRILTSEPLGSYRDRLGSLATAGVSPEESLAEALARQLRQMRPGMGVRVAGPDQGQTVAGARLLLIAHGLEELT